MRELVTLSQDDQIDIEKVITESEALVDSDDDVLVENRPAIIMENMAQYEGQWKVGTNVRHGKGIQIWMDGSIYEGWWRKDKTHGHGRVIHANGDVYIGTWKNDMANGFGEFLNHNVSKYEGTWIDNE